jgi:hypothetical protein
MRRRKTNNPNLKRIAETAQTKAFETATQQKPLLTAQQQNRLMQMEIQRKLAKIACEKALKKAGIKTKRTGELINAAQTLAEESARMQGTATQSHAFNAAQIIDKIITDPNKRMVFYQELTKEMHTLTQRTSTEKILLK